MSGGRRDKVEVRLKRAWGGGDGGQVPRGQEGQGGTAQHLLAGEALNLRRSGADLDTLQIGGGGSGQAGARNQGQL